MTEEALKEQAYGFVADVKKREESLELRIQNISGYGFPGKPRGGDFLCTIPYEVKDANGKPVTVTPELFNKNVAVTLNRYDHGEGYNFELILNTKRVSEKTFEPAKLYWSTPYC